MARVGVLQHFWCENAGVFETTLLDAGHELVYHRLCDGAPVPSLRDAQAWIVMGGPMNVDEVDKHAWLLPERELLAGLIEADRPVLGICLGAQLIARSAGARVYAKRPKEIGLFDVALTQAAAADPLFKLFDDPQEVLQWHGDTFDLPAGAVHLARSERFEHQAFRLGRRVYGLQFHLECTEEIVRNLGSACSAELAELPASESWARWADDLPAALARQNGLASRVVLQWAELFDPE